MRSHIFGRNFNDVPLRTFNAGARDAKELMEYERSPEGIAFAAQVEDELLNPEKYR